MKQTINITEDHSERIDHDMMRELDLSRSIVQKMIQSNKILVNQNPVKNSYRLKKGDVVTIEEYVPEEMKAEAEKWI